MAVALVRQVRGVEGGGEHCLRVVLACSVAEVSSSSSSSSSEVVCPGLTDPHRLSCRRESVAAFRGRATFRLLEADSPGIGSSPIGSVFAEIMNQGTLQQTDDALSPSLPYSQQSAMSAL